MSIYKDLTHFTTTTQFLTLPNIIIHDMFVSTSRRGSAYDEHRPAGTLVITERWWRDRYIEIEKQGYRLRPRYHPHWEPSWPKTGKDFYTAEDGQATIVRVVGFITFLHILTYHPKLRAAMDATRIRDGRQVMLKKVLPADGPQELNINRLFSSPEHFGNRNNHCAPLLDVIELSENFNSQKLMVFPLLRPFDQPPIQTFREFADFFTQICEVRPKFLIHLSF